MQLVPPGQQIEPSVPIPKQGGYPDIQLIGPDYLAEKNSKELGCQENADEVDGNPVNVLIQIV
jgi:hypothetical protein